MECLDCGCGLPNCGHNDPNHILLADLAAAAQASGIGPLQAAQNILATVRAATGSA